jgi:hypothetical protein
MSAELEARRIAAAAVLADFNKLPQDREHDRLIIAAWAARLAAELGSLLEQLGHETPGPLEQLGTDAVVRMLGQIRLVLDVLDWHDSGLFQDALEQIDDILRGER